MFLIYVMFFLVFPIIGAIYIYEHVTKLSFFQTSNIKRALFGVGLGFAILLILGTIGDFQKNSTDEAYQRGYDVGVQETEDAHKSDYSLGYEVGDSDGYERGYDEGYDDGYEDGRTEGYGIGYDDAGFDGGTESNDDVDYSDLWFDDTPTVTYDEPAVNANSAYYVYVTPHGKKYHTFFCQYIKNQYTEYTLEQAQSMGYTPCSVCKP